MTACPKLNPVRDRKYLDWLRTQRCLITGQAGHEYETIDPCHIGTTGKGWSAKCSDDECIPLLHRFHQKGGEVGEMSELQRLLPDIVLDEAAKLYAAKYGYELNIRYATHTEFREAIRLYAKQMYRDWKENG